MRVGIVAYWFNRGQATVARWLRETLDASGHETYLLARPTKDKFVHPRRVDTQDVWAQRNVTAASSHEIPVTEYLHWADTAGLDVVMVDQNYQFTELATLRRRGVRLIGRFVWEAISPERAREAVEVFDVIYSFTRAEQERYRELGISSPLVPFGCHPELFSHARSEDPERSDDDVVRFFYPAGFVSRRKPTGAVVQAFGRVDAPEARLTIKSQRSLQREDLVLPQDCRDLKRRVVKQLVASGHVAPLDDARIDVVSHDVSADEYYRLFASHDVCLAPSRWEGLGIHLYEATAFGLPIIANDMKPINEVVRHQENGWLCSAWQVGSAPSGIAAYEPHVASLTEGIEAMMTVAKRRAASRKALERRAELDWRKTQEAVTALVEGTSDAIDHSGHATIRNDDPL